MKQEVLNGKRLHRGSDKNCTVLFKKFKKKKNVRKKKEKKKKMNENVVVQAQSHDYLKKKKFASND